MAKQIFITQEEERTQHTCPYCGGYCEEDFDHPGRDFCYNCNRTHDAKNYEFVIVDSDKDWEERNNKE